MAGEAHPVPSRTRKLSPRAPIVLRSKSVGEQDAAGHQGAFCQGRPPQRERRGPPRISRRPACRAGGPRGRVRPPGPLSGIGDRAPASAPEAREQGRDGALGEGRHAVRGAADGGVHAAPAQGRVPVDLRLCVGKTVTPPAAGRPGEAPRKLRCSPCGGPVFSHGNVSDTIIQRLATR